MPTARSRAELIDALLLACGVTAAPQGCALRDSATTTTACLQLALDLVQGRTCNVAECIDSEDRFVAATMLCLKSGCPYRLTGTILVAALTAASPSVLATELERLASGGVGGFDGQSVAATLRHCRLGSCRLGSGQLYTGGWLAGRMAGHGCITHAGGGVVYRGAFQVPAQRRPPHGPASYVRMT